MPAPIEQSLANLLPTVSFLPPDLVSLASSLLAQSRAKASSLKPEEEIGRTYACAHIACARLQKRLDLEIGKPAPPVKPRVYDKLYKYLDSALSTPRTPQTTRFKDATATGSGSMRASAKEPDARVQEIPKTPTTSGKKRTREEGPQIEQQEKDVPDFVMPMIRAICRATNLPTAVPHINVGAEAVVREIISRNQKQKEPPASRSKRRRTATPQSARAAPTATAAGEETRLATARWPALLVSLFLLVAANLHDLEPSHAQIQSLRATAVDRVHTFCRDASTANLASRLAKLDGDVSFYLLEAEDCGWLEMEWYRNIPTGRASAAAEVEIPESEGEAEDGNEGETVVTPRARPYKTPLRRGEKHGGKRAEGVLGPAGLAYGLGTMFQPAVDWLSEARRAEYARWKRGILKEIAAAVEQAA